MREKIRVLHIDDNLHDRKLVKDVLLNEHDGFEVVEADDREKFIKHLNEKDFDIILSDFNILGFDGLQVLEIVKEKYPNMPVIIITGTGSEEIAIQAMKSGAADYVIKSVSHIRGLAHSIQLVLENKKNQKARKKALSALKRSEEKYRKIFENVQDVFYQTDSGGIITEMSPSIFRVSGYQREELIGKLASVFYYNPDDRIRVIEKIIADGEVWDFEIRMITKDGLIKYASLNAHGLYNEMSEFVGIEGSLRDITDRKQVEAELYAAKEKAEENDRLKTAFLHNISHEIRTPMNSIVGFAELLNESEILPEIRKEYTDIIVNSSNYLLSIISDIVRIATIEAGQEKIIEREMNLNSALQLIHHQFMLKSQSQNIQFNLTSILPNQNAQIMADETKLVQVINNLIVNALKFTKQGSISFGCRMLDQPNDNSMIEFFVEDTGIGIADKMQHHVFKRFSQVENTSTRQFGGSGLGLSISKAYIEMMGGKIWLKSELGKGSTFYFTIPYKSGSRC